MKFEYSSLFWKDFSALSKENAKYAVKLMELLRDIEQQPFTGIGKPEALKHGMAGYWSRRISDKHRLIYMVEAVEVNGEQSQLVRLVSCYGHYTDK